MVYLWIFLGLFIAVVLLGIANLVLTKVKKNKEKQKKGEE